MPPDPARRLHANRPFSIPWSSNQSKGVFSRSDILTDKQPSAWGSDQSLGVAVSGENPHIVSTIPQKWFNAGRVLKVPKCVILSSLPEWTLYWPGCYFYGPRDVIGQMFTPPFAFGNYYYFEQWNYGDPNQQILDTSTFSDGNVPLNSPFWSNFNPPVPDGSKIEWTESYFDEHNQQPPPPTDFILPNISPPAPRFNQIIGTVQNNPYYSLHQQLMQTFAQAKMILESDPVDPIYVTIPGWLPALYQTRNGFLTKNDEAFNSSHGTGCAITDAAPCYNVWEIPWGPFYPNGKDSRNRADFPCTSVPYLATTDPGFGTNVLHMYVGHACHRYDNDASIFGWQAWPLQPEGQYLGPTFSSNYIGANLPYFAGRRNVWRDYGFDYGFLNHGPNGIYQTYGALIQAAADQYKKNFYNYRQFATRLFNYGQSIQVAWQTQNIWMDQKHDCHSTAFYFGLTFDEFVAAHTTEDQWYNDCFDSPQNPAHLKYAEGIQNFPDSPSLRLAISEFYPPIQQRVNAYYGGIEQGTADLYKLIIKNQGLADFNVQYGGTFQPLLDVDALVGYIRDYFAKNP